MSHPRTGTYVAFHAGGTSDPSDSDIKYFNLLKAWLKLPESDFHFVDSHQKTAAVRDSSKRQTLERALITRLRRSKNMILIMTDETRFDDDWVPFEIQYAIDQCRLPIIVAYPGYDWICRPGELRHMWPLDLAARLDGEVARSIHIPFKQRPLSKAVSAFSVDRLPSHPITIYKDDLYKRWGLAP